jgi:hypothetical protein
VRAQVADTTLWCPDGIVYGIAVGGGRVFVYGTFTSFRGAPRHYLASLDAATGKLTDWAPYPDGQVFGIGYYENKVYVAGQFTNIDATPRQRFAVFDATTGALTTKTYTDSDLGSINAMVVQDGTVYIADSYFLEAIDAASCTLKWFAYTNMSINDVAVEGPRVFVGGRFTSINGVPRANLAALDLNWGTVLPWDPSPNGVVSRLAASGNVLYVAGSFSIIGQTTPAQRDRFAAVDITTCNPTAWNPGIGGQATDLIASGGVLYVAGSFTEIAGTRRNCLAALNLSDGSATSWAPEPSAVVYSLALDGATVYAGGAFPEICGQPQAFLARMPDSPTGTLLARFDAEVVSEGVRLQWQFQAAVRAVSVERSESEAGPWTRPPVEMAEREGMTEALDRTAEPGHGYWYRLVATLADGSTSEFGPIRADLPGVITLSGIIRVSPNPTNGVTHIAYQAARQEPVRVSIVDVAGRETEVLFDGDLTPGRYSAVWDGAGRHGRLPAGVYFVRWRSPSRSMDRRLVLMR